MPSGPIESSTSLLDSWTQSVQRRMRVYPGIVHSNNCLRLIHNEGFPLRADQLGPVTHMGWWRNTQPTTIEQRSIDSFIQWLNPQHWVLRHYPKQAQDRKILGQSYEAPSAWTAKENQVLYEFRQDQGLSPGLFLDQRDNRLWVKANSRQKKILNLFCYTGGFSVCSALGEASQVSSVDLSSNYIQWTKDNFALNQLDITKHRFHAMETMEFLKYAKKKDLKYDLIICDPPSFGRHNKKVFRIDKDYDALLHACLEVLPPGGQIVFSSNYERWDWQQWHTNLSELGRTSRFEVTPTPSKQLDFEIGSSKSLLKAFHITKK